MGQAKSSLDFHKGQAFIKVAGFYPTIFDVILESVQNAIDSGARSIQVVLNRRTRNIAIRDDGQGVGREAFEKALHEVCSSQKEAGKLGKFGIGLISPLGKCVRFSFTSCPRSVRSEGYLEWTFVSSEIEQRAGEIEIPWKKRTDLSFKKPAPGVTPLAWRTEVKIEKYSTDKTISRINSIDSLAEAIIDKFGVPMRKHDISLDLKFVNEDGSEEFRNGVKAKQYTGKPLSEKVISNSDAGDVHFRLYLTRKTTKGLKGKVSVGELGDDFRFVFRLLANSAEKLIPDEVVHALTSGVFEGEILASKVKLHPNRKSFERNDALLGFCMALEEWYERIGRKHLEEVQKASQDERYQDLGLRSLSTIEKMLQSPDFTDLRDILNSFKRGNVGEGHTRRPRGVVVGEQTEPALATVSVDGAGGETSGSPHSSEERDSQDDLPGHHPFTVTGPKGKSRTIVRKDSLGLQLSHTGMEESDRLWELDAVHGILHFNVCHPVWVSCESSDRKLMQLQELITVQALTLLTVPDDWQEQMRKAFDEMNGPFLHLLHNSTAFILRRKDS